MVVLVISATQALLVSVLFAFGFVASLYIWRNSILLSRDDPRQILRRFVSIMGWSFACFLIVRAFAVEENNLKGKAGADLLTWLGFPTFSLIGTIYPLLLTMSLFLGPIISGLLRIKGEFDAGLKVELYGDESVLVLFRNLVVGPFFEEFVFRNCICCLLIASGYTAMSTILLSPFLFGIAHVHHLVDHVTSRGVPLLRAAKVVSFQLCYTTLFGMYASYVLIQTGQFISIFLIHAFCNFMGFPDLSFLSAGHVNYPKRNLIITIYLIGIAIFSLTISFALDSTLYGSWLAKLTQI